MTADPSSEIYRLINGYQITQGIHAAVTLGVPDLLKQGALTCNELARRVGAHPRALYRLLRALAAAGVLHEDDRKSFCLTPMGECLCSDSPTSAGAWAVLVGRPYMWQAWGHLLHSVKTGENAFTDINGQSVWQYRAEHGDENDIFNRAMTALSRATVDAVLKACDFTRFGWIVDVGGGQGRMITGILAANPNMRGTLFDQPHVVATARPIIGAANLEDRCDIVAGSFFEKVPSGAEAYIMRVVLHDWEDDEAIAILNICRQAVPTTGRLLIIERVIAPPNEGLVGKFSDLNMLVSPGGRERTREEFSYLCNTAGFEVASVTPAGPALSVIEASPR